VEVDLEKGLPEAIQLNLDNWSYIQQVDYEQIPFKCKACHEYGHFAKNFPQVKETQDQDPKQDQWQQPKRKKATGKNPSNPPQGQREKSPGPRERPSGSPHKGESSHNRYVGLPIEGNTEELREIQEENGKKRQEETEEEVRKGKEKEIMITSGESTTKSHPNLSPELPYFSEDERQDTSDSDTDLEVTQPTITKKPGRKSHRNKRESTADREKELGIQKTIEEALKKEGKSGKNKSPNTREQHLIPLKGGHQNPLINDESCLLEL
jgi:hypothetical protein